MEGEVPLFPYLQNKEVKGEVVWLLCNQNKLPFHLRQICTTKAKEDIFLIYIRPLLFSSIIL